MNIELFYTLKEIQSLYLANQKNQQLITEEEKRLHELVQKMKDKIDEQTLKQEELNQIKNHIEDREKKLTQRLEARIQEDAEKELWELMIKQENEEIALKDLKQFIEGYGKTLKELEGEIQNTIRKHHLELSQRNHRITLLLDQLPGEVQNIVKSRQALNLKVSLFTKTTAQGCFICNRTLNRTELDEVDIQLKVKTCPGCQRIFLPYQVVSG